MESPPPGSSARSAEREAMLRIIADTALATQQHIGRRAFSTAVMQALRRVPRHAFVPEESTEDAYRDCALPISRGQTISQPYIVALMTDLAAVTAASKVLEIGTGSGYQAAVLAELADRVYSVELDPRLAQRSERRLRELGYANVRVRAGDGWDGWSEHAPYDAILVTAAVEEVPPPLLGQLVVGGRVVAPVDAGPSVQDLTLLTRETDETLSRRPVLPVMFVRFRRAPEDAIAPLA